MRYWLDTTASSVMGRSREGEECLAVLAGGSVEGSK
jgi:hypothetical protein